MRVADIADRNGHFPPRLNRSRISRWGSALGQIPSFGLAGRRQGELPEFTLCLLRAAPDRLVLDGFGLRLQRAGLVGERVDPEAVWGKFARDSPLEGGVSCELVSENAKFPASEAAKKGMKSVSYGPIPYAS